MKRIAFALFTFHFSLFTCLFAAPVVQEVTVYPFAATITHQDDLVIEEYVPLDAKRPGKKWTFKNPNVSKRTVWSVTAESNTVFNAWLDTDGNGKYDIGEPFGTSAGRDYPEIELSHFSPIMPRIDLTTGMCDRGHTFKWVLDDIVNRSDQLPAWAKNNKPTSTTASKGDRIRVVRWLVSDVPIYSAGSSQHVVFDKTIETDERRTLTEADILEYAGNDIDIDFERTCDDITEHMGAQLAVGGHFTRSVYLVVVGDGLLGWYRTDATNEVRAIETAIIRSYQEGREIPIPLIPSMRDGEVTLRWKIEDLNRRGVTGFRAKVYNGATLVHDTGLFRSPARWADGSFHWTITNALPAGTYDWNIAAFNSKYSKEVVDEYPYSTEAYTNGVPFTVTGE